MIPSYVKARSLHHESCGISSYLDFPKFEMAQSCRLCGRVHTVDEGPGLYFIFIILV